MAKLTVNTKNFERARLMVGKKATNNAKRAARYAINRAGTAARKEAKKIAKEQRKTLKTKPINERIFIKKPKNLTGGIDNLSVTLRISNKSLALIHFVKGKRTPQNQRGIPVAKRKRLKVQIERGKVQIRKRAFIARGRNNNVHVFLREKGRTKNGNQKMNSQMTPSFAHVMKDQRHKSRIEQRAQEVLNKQFRHYFGYLNKKAVARARK